MPRKPELSTAAPLIPPRLFRDLLLKATEVVQQRLFSAARPETQAEIRRVLAKVSDELGAMVAARDYSAAQRVIEALRQEGKLGTIQPGAYADMLVVDGDPLKDLGLFKDGGPHLAAIMKAGKFYKNAL